MVICILKHVNVLLLGALFKGLCAYTNAIGTVIGIYASGAIVADLLHANIDGEHP